MATRTCPGCGAAVSHDDLICFTCGTNLPRRGPVEEESAPGQVGTAGEADQIVVAHGGAAARTGQCRHGVLQDREAGVPGSSNRA